VSVVRTLVSGRIQLVPVPLLFAASISAVSVFGRRTSVSARVNTLLLVDHGVIGCRRRGLLAGPVVDLVLLQELLHVQSVQSPEVVNHRHQLRENGRLLWMLRQQNVAQNQLELALHLVHKLGIPQTRTICGDDDNSAKESDFGVRQPELVHPVGESEDGVHEEPGVAWRHVRDGLLPDHVAVQTDQGLAVKET